MGTFNMEVLTAVSNYRRLQGEDIALHPDTFSLEVCTVYVPASNEPPRKRLPACS